MDLKAESLRFKRVDGLSYSTTVPSLKTAIKSESKIVFSRWAIVMTVQSLNSERIVFWIRSSVSISIAAVASSKIRIFVFRSKALDKQISCRWPTEKLEPDSVTSWSKPFSRLWTWAFKWACSSAEINAILIIFFSTWNVFYDLPVHKEASSKVLVGSKLKRNFPRWFKIMKSF